MSIATNHRSDDSVHGPGSHSGHVAEKKAVRDAKNNHRPSRRKSQQPKDDFRNERERRQAAGVNWPITLWLVMLHVGALAAPWTFSWTGLAVFLVFHWLNGSIGICLGYHRLLTHGSFQTYHWVKLLFAWIGGLAGEGSAIDWVANHRKHHAHSDQDDDPHTPRQGSWWSHAFWLAYVIQDSKENEEHCRRWAPDLAKDPGMRFVGKLFLPTHFAVGGALLGVGYAVDGWMFGLSLLVWGLFLRLVAVLHTTWFVNSASHMWGYRNYETTDDSRNSWWVALLAYGEGWHNNHHAYPRMAVHGHKWWEYDLTYRAIQLLKVCGLAWDVVDYKHVNEK